MTVNQKQLAFLPLILSGLIPSHVKADIYTFEQSSATSGEVSPSYWTFELPSYGNYTFATWFSQDYGTVGDGNTGDPWLHIFQGSSQVGQRDDGGRINVFGFSEGIIPGFTSENDAHVYSTFLEYEYSSGSSTHTLVLGNYPDSRNCTSGDLEPTLSCIESFGLSQQVVNTLLFSDFDVTGSGTFLSQVSTALQPYAAMGNVGLKSIHNNRDLVLAKAGECNNYGWVIEDTDYCLYTNAKNRISYVNGDSNLGSYGSAVFNGSINLEKTINDKWKAGLSYGIGTANLYDFDFSNTTANLKSTNNHYSVYGVKKVSDTFTLKGIVGGSTFDYQGNRNHEIYDGYTFYESANQ